MFKIMCWIILIFPIIDINYNLIDNTKVGILYNITSVTIILLFEFVIMSKKKLTDIIVFNFILIFIVYMAFLNDHKINYYTQCLLVFLIITRLFSEKDIIVSFKQFMLQKFNLIELFTWLYLGTLLISIFLGSGFYVDWGVKSLKGPYVYSHTLAYMSLGMYSLYTFFYNNKKISRYQIIRAIFILIIIFSAVRSAALALVVLLFHDVLVLGIKSKIKVLALIPIVILAVVLSAGFIFNSSLVQKNINTYDAGSVSNGRDIFWKADMDYFSEETTLTEKLLGSGMDIVTSINYSATGDSIQAHNDFINLIIGYGIVTLIIFVLNIALFCKFKRGIFLLFVLYILAFTNGLFIYFNFVIIMPFLLLHVNNVKGCNCGQ